MAHNPTSVLQSLKKEEYAPVYFLQGEETYYIDLLSEFIEKHVLDEGEKGFNQTILYGKDVAISDVLNQARRFPMMAERQVVIVKEAQQISDLNKEGGQKLLLSYLESPVPSTVLVFCHKNKTLDKRKALGRKIEKLAVSVTCKKLYDNQVPDWISQYLKDKKVKSTPKAVQMLADSIGNNLERLANEIEKVLINLSEGDVLDEHVVHQQVGISKDYNVFELQKAMITRDIHKANQIASYFEANPKQNPLLPVLAVLFSFYSKLLIAFKTADKSERALASALGVNPYFAKDYTQALRIYTLAKVIQNIHFIKEADLKAKGVGNPSTPDGQLLKELIYKLLH